jgi:hypothetical protein
LTTDLPLITATRRNHAVEHATIAILFRRRGRVVSVAGRSDPWGFFIAGPFSVEEVEAAAGEALVRLKAGEHHLAYTNLCGTNIVVGGVLAGAVALLSAGRSRKDNWQRALTAAMVASLASGKLGMSLQRHVTVQADLGRTELRNVRRLGQGGRVNTIRVTLGA